MTNTKNYLHPSLLLKFRQKDISIFSTLKGILIAILIATFESKFLSKFILPSNLQILWCFYDTIFN